MNFPVRMTAVARAGLPIKKRMAATIELIAANYAAHRESNPDLLL